MVKRSKCLCSRRNIYLSSNHTTHLTMLNSHNLSTCSILNIYNCSVCLPYCVFTMFEWYVNFKRCYMGCISQWVPGKKETSKLRVAGLWVEFTGDQWIPYIMGQLRGKCFHLMTSSWWWVLLGTPWHEANIRDCCQFQLNVLNSSRNNVEYSKELSVGTWYWWEALRLVLGQPIVS